MIKKTTTIVTAALLLFSASSAAQTTTLKGGYSACISESLFDEFISAAVNDDERGMNHLLANGCFVTKPGIEISVLDRSWSGTAKVRAYVGNDSLVLWTNTENIQR